MGSKAAIPFPHRSNGGHLERLVLDETPVPPTSADVFFAATGAKGSSFHPHPGVLPPSRAPWRRNVEQGLYVVIVMFLCFSSSSQFSRRFLVSFQLHSYFGFAWKLQNVYIVVRRPFFTDLAECFWIFIILESYIWAKELRASADCFKFSCRVLMQLLVIFFDAINLRKVSGYVVRETAQKHQTSTTLIHSWNSVIRFESFAFLRQMKATSLWPRN